MTEVPAQTLKEIVTKKITPVQHRVFSILRHLKVKGASSFEDVMLSSTTRSELIASFAALLQLIRRHLVIITSEDDPENPILEINYGRTKYNPDAPDHTAAEAGA